MGYVKKTTSLSIIVICLLLIDAIRLVFSISE